MSVVRTATVSSRPSRGRRAACDARGFTLLELLVALSVLGLIAFLAFDALRFGLRAWGATVERGTGLHDVTSAQRFLRSRLESSYPFDVDPVAAPQVSPLLGDERSLAFSAHLTHAARIPGRQRFTIARVPNTRGGFDLEVSWRMDRNGRIDTREAAAARETLLADVADVEFGYFSTDAGAGRWLNTWRGRGDPPQLVRMRVTFAPHDLRHWPEFVAAPRITADANCAFDAVSQRCR